MLVHPQFNPIALQLGPVAVHWYGITYLVAFGLSCGWRHAVSRSPISPAAAGPGAMSKTCCSMVCSAS